MQDSLRYESDLWKKDRVSYYLNTGEIHPEDYNALRNRGMKNLKLKFYADALADFKASLEADLVSKDAVPSVTRNKHKSESYFYIGICFELLEQTDSAQFYLDKAIEINPYYDDAYIEHASIDLRNGRSESAFNTLYGAYERNKMSRKLITNLAALYIENGQFQKAKRLLKSSVKLIPGFADPYISLATIYLMESKFGTAKEYLEKAIEIDSTSADALYLLGSYQYSQEEYEDAFVSISKMYEIDSTNMTANYMLGLLQIRFANYDEGFNNLYTTLHSRLDRLMTFDPEDFIFLELADILKTLSDGYLDSTELNLFHNYIHAEITDQYDLRNYYWQELSESYPSSLTRARMILVDDLLICEEPSMTGCNLKQLKLLIGVVLAADSSLVNIRFFDGYLDFKDGKYDQALKMFEGIIDTWPDYRLAYYYKAKCLIDNKRYTKAIIALDSALIRYPFFADAERLRADIYLNHIGSYRSAMLAYKNFWNLQPFEDLAIIGVAKSYSNLNMPDSAIFYYNLAIKLNPSKEEARYDRGLEYYKVDKYDSAIVDFSFCINSSFEYLKSLVFRGFCYNETGQTDKSIKDLNTVLDYDKNNGSIYYNIGELFFDQSKYSKALKYFDDGISMAPDYPWNYYGKAKCLSMDGDYKSGIMYCMQATQHDPEFAMAYREAGDNFYRLENFRQSYFFYKKSAELDNTMYGAMFNTGLCMLRLGRIEEAMKLYEAYTGIPGIESTIYFKEAIIKLKNLYYQDIFKNDVLILLTEVFKIEIEEDILSP